MNFYKRYPADYQRKTARLTLAQHGAYTLLLDEFYTTETPLPAEIGELFRICRAMSKPEQEAVCSIADRFFPINGDGYRHNKRADEEIKEAVPAINAARENGKLGGRPNKTSENPVGNPVGNPEKKGYIATAPPEPIENPVGNPVGCEPENPVGSKSMKKGPKEPKKPRRNPVGFQTQTQKEPSGKAPQISDKENSSSLRSEEIAREVFPLSDLLAVGFDEQTAVDFIAHKAKLKAPLTVRAWKDHLVEAQKAGWTPSAAAEKVMAKNWKGFEAKYVANEALAGTPRQQSHRERDTANAADRVRDMTGGLLDDTKRATKDVVDMEDPNAARIADR